MSKSGNLQNKITRRQFVRGGAAGIGAAAAAPWIIPASALGREAGRAAPSDRIGMAIIGLGTIAGCSETYTPDWIQQGKPLDEESVQQRAAASRRDGHFYFLSQGSPHSQVVAVCDVNRKRLENTRAMAEFLGLGGIRATTDFREVLARKDVDAVVVSTPDHWHAAIAIEACRQGKDVYCDKPLALSIGDGRAIADAVHRYGRVFQSGSQSRSIPGLWAVCKLVRDGLLGKIKEVSVNLGKPPSICCPLPAQTAPKHIDWEMWLGPAPWRPYHANLAHVHWRGYRDFGGGMLDVGSHALDVMQCSLGMDRTGPVEATPPDKSMDGSPQTLRYANGTIIRNSSRRKVPTHIARAFRFQPIHVIGTQGEAWFSLLSSRWFVEPEPLRREFEVLVAQTRAEAPSTAHHANFIESIRTRRQPITDVESAHRSITLGHLMCIAAWTGRTIRWDPVAEQIVGDNEAARLTLRRPMREPWRF